MTLLSIQNTSTLRMLIISSQVIVRCMGFHCDNAHAFLTVELEVQATITEVQSGTGRYYQPRAYTSYSHCLFKDI